MAHPDARVERIHHGAPGEHPLGRHIHHDPTSLERFSLSDRVRGVTPATKAWRRASAPFNQGRTLHPDKSRRSVGSCVWNTVLGLVDTADHNTPKGRRFTWDTWGYKGYAYMTKIDPFAGSYPWDDTGSDGVSGCKTAQFFGLIPDRYWWGRGVLELIRIVSALGPCGVGIPWPTGFDRPNVHGVLSLTGNDRGGHEVEVIAYHADNSLGAPVDRYGPLLEIVNSWGEWGVKGSGSWPYGRAYVRVADMDNRLQRGGDVVTFSQP